VKLIEADESKPSDEDDPTLAIPRPPRPEHRRVYVSLAFTILVLVGTVVTIYGLVPERHHVLAETVVATHRTQPAWQLTSPSPGEVRAWIIGVVGEKAPVPPGIDQAMPIGARVVDVHRRRAAVVRFQIGDDEITYAVGRARGMSPGVSRRDGDLRVEAWRVGPFMIAVAGPDATAARWRPIVRGP
jgi:hypothetical protein